MDHEEIEVVARALYAEQPDRPCWTRTADTVKTIYRTVAAQIIAQLDELRTRAEKWDASNRLRKLRDRLHVVLGLVA
jgi:hypothetical protein